MNNRDDGNNENNTNSIDIMTITITTVMAMVIIIQYLFVYMLTQQLNGQVRNRQEYTKNDVNTYKQTNNQIWTKHKTEQKQNLPVQLKTNNI
jgi:hypothetical protein